VPRSLRRPLDLPRQPPNDQLRPQLHFAFSFPRSQREDLEPAKTQGERLCQAVWISPSRQVVYCRFLSENERMIHKGTSRRSLQCNCSIIGDETTHEAMIIDPGDDIEDILPSSAKTS